MCRPQHRHEAWLQLLRLIADHHFSHTHPAVQAGLAKHLRLTQVCQLSAPFPTSSAADPHGFWVSLRPTAHPRPSLLQQGWRTENHRCWPERQAVPGRGPRYGGLRCATTALWCSLWGRTAELTSLPAVGFVQTSCGESVYEARFARRLETSARARGPGLRQAQTVLRTVCVRAQLLAATEWAPAGHRPPLRPAAVVFGTPPLLQQRRARVGCGSKRNPESMRVSSRRGRKRGRKLTNLG